jgi:uncharacterized membrane protein
MALWRPAASSLRDAFITATLAWAALLVVIPYLAGRGHVSTPASALVLGIYAIGSLICHQLPERSYQLWSTQMPVCARCAGIYFGAVVGALGARLVGLRIATRRLAGHAPERARVLLGLAVIPTATTLAYEWSTGDMPAHAIRAAAGVPIGVVVAWLVVAAADNQVN